MGGMYGFGEVTHEENEPVFHETWVGKVMETRRSLVKHEIFKPYNCRFTVESLNLSEYLNSCYYESHLRTTENGAIAKGFIAREEMDERMEFFRQNPYAFPERRENPKELKQK